MLVQETSAGTSYTQSEGVHDIYRSQGSVENPSFKRTDNRIFMTLIFSTIQIPAVNVDIFFTVPSSQKEYFIITMNLRTNPFREQNPDT